MTAASDPGTRGTPTGAPSSAGSRSLPALLAAAALVVVVVGLVLTFGVARPPGLATVREEPTPSPEASLAWTEWRDGGGCIHMVDPQGERSEVGCRYEGQHLAAWTDEGIVLLAGPVDTAEVIDPETGEIVGQLATEAGEWLEPRSDPVRTGYVDGVLTVTLRETGTELWRVEAPENYRINDAVRSPDGRWVVLVDGSGRLLLVPADGSAEPRVWAEAEEGWVHPVWEGSTPPSPTGS